MAEVLEQSIADVDHGGGAQPRRFRPRWIGGCRAAVCGQAVRVPFSLTGVEKGDTQRVLDGDLDDYIEASLKQGV